MKKYRVITLGCRTNQYESQAFSDQLQHVGYREALPNEQAEICIVNTCTVTASADKRSLYQIRKMARENHPEQLIVTGCFAEKLADMPEVTHVIPNRDKDMLLPLVFPEEDWPEFQIKRFEAHTRAFVKVQDGCNSYCSYCIIPYVRGRSRSRKIDAIIQEIEDLVNNGYREVVLTGINIGDFDGDQSPPATLADLVKRVDHIEGLDRIRISSIDPDEVDDALLEAVIGGKKTCPSMHIVLQSGSNLTLKRMRRKYTRQDFIDTTTRLLQCDPDFTFTTDVIVGFPGESESEFEETLDLIREVQFAKVHMFPYSDRPKTRASRMPNKVAPEVMEKRRKKVLEVAHQAAFELREKYIGRTFDVLLEQKDTGHTRHFLPVMIPGLRSRPNSIMRITCRVNGQDGLIGYEENQVNREIQAVFT